MKTVKILGLAQVEGLAELHEPFVIKGLGCLQDNEASEDVS
jgi:hypothetical protein